MIASIRNDSWTNDSRARLRDIKPGDVIADKYVVRSILGRSRGVLVEAFHAEFDQRVAVRLVSTLGDERDVLRFRRETRTLGKLESEHAARIMDAGRLPDGTAYLVRQYLDGVNLAQYVQNKSGLPIAEAVAYVLQVAEALAETHSHGLVLRELQPSQVFLANRRGGGYTAKIIDFGTAKAAHLMLVPGDDVATKTIELSPYSSPELVRRSPDIDVRSDVWSLGAILYELIAGFPPFDGAAATLMLAIAKSPHTPLSQLRSDVPTGLDTLLASALAKDAESRCPNVFTFASGLRTLAGKNGLYLIDRIRAHHEVNHPSAEMRETLLAEDVVEVGRESFDSMSDPATLIRDPSMPPMGSVPPMPSAPPVATRTPGPGFAALPVTPLPPPLPGHRTAKMNAMSTLPPPPPKVMSPLPSPLPPPLPPPAKLPTLNQAANASVAPPARSAPVAAPAPAMPKRRVGLLVALIVVLGAAIAGTVAYKQGHTPAELYARVRALIGKPEAPVAVAPPTEATAAPPVGDTSAPADTTAAPPAAAATDAPEQAPVATADTAAQPPTESPAATVRTFGHPAHTASAHTTSTAPRPTAPEPVAAPPAPPPATQAPSSDAMGSLVVMTVGGPCALAVNGSPKGTSSILKVPLKAGSYSVSCRPESGAMKSRTVTITPGQNAVITFKL